MGSLYNRHLDFPKPINKTYFFLSVVFSYGVFCLDPQTMFYDKAYDFKFLYNDFSVKGNMSFVVASIYMYIFLFITFRAATSFITDKLLKSIFYTLMIDSIVSIINVIIFGDYNPIESIVVRNCFVVLAMLYAYYILPHDEQ